MITCSAPLYRVNACLACMHRKLDTIQMMNCSKGRPPRPPPPTAKGQGAAGYGDWRTIEFGCQNVRRRGCHLVAMSLVLGPSVLFCSEISPCRTEEGSATRIQEASISKVVPTTRKGSRTGAKVHCDTGDCPCAFCLTCASCK